MYTVIDPGHKINCSCTVIWILRYTHYYAKLNVTHQYAGISQIDYQDIVQDKFPLAYCLFETNFDDLLVKCDFDARLSMCNKTNFSRVNNKDFRLNTDKDLINLIKFIQYVLFVYFNQIFAFIGIVTNFMVVVVIKNFKNLKKDQKAEVNKKKDMMFAHILIHSIFNVIYCFIMIFKLVNICLFFTPSFFCSSIATEPSAQWFKIIFIEFMGTLTKTCCNVSYTAISISRIFLTSENKYKGCCATKFKNLNIIIYLVVMLFLSSILSIFKIFIFKVNRMDDISNIIYLQTDFPIIINNNAYCNNNIYDILNCLVWDILRIANNFVNDIFFFLIAIIYDIVVLKNISSMIKSKKSIVQNFKETEEEKKRKRILKMIIINGIIFTFSHLPEFLISILFLVIQNKLNFCIIFQCDILNDCAQFFIYFSIISQFSINKNFNSLFSESYENIKIKLKNKFQTKTKNLS